MSEVRKRTVGDASAATRDVNDDHKEDVESEDDGKIEVDELAKTLQQGTNHTPEVFNAVLSGLPDRWRNWVIRGIFTLLMIGGFCLIIYGGPLALMVTVSIYLKLTHVRAVHFSDKLSLRTPYYKLGYP